MKKAKKQADSVVDENFIDQEYMDDLARSGEIVMRVCREEFETNQAALHGLILMVAVLAKTEGMMLEQLLEGLGHAYRDIDVISKKGMDS